MKFSQIERGINNFSAASRGDQKFNRVFHPVSTTPPPPPPRELKNDNSLIYFCYVVSFYHFAILFLTCFSHYRYVISISIL